MRWQALASATLAGVLAGCVSEPAYVGDGFKPLTANDGIQRSRSQKPEPAPAKLDLPKSLLDLPPERGGDPNVCQVCASIRATVNGKAILDEEVRQACYALLIREQQQNLRSEERAARQKEILNATLENLVERELLVQDAVARLKSPQGKKFLEKMTEVANKEFDRWLSNLKGQLQLKSDDEVKEWLRVQGLSLDGMRKQKEKQLLAEEYLRQMVMDAVNRVGHEQIVEYYQTHPEEFQVSESVQWQDMLIDVNQYASRDEARKVAQELVRRLQAKEDFVKLAEMYDPRGFRFTHGEGNGQKRGQIQPPEVEVTLFHLREGEAAVVEIPTGFHVIRMVMHTRPGRMPFDDKVQGQIRDKLRNEVGVREQKRFLSQLRSKGTIEYSNRVP